MRQRLSLVTLGVHDKERARRFYADMGWSEGTDGADGAPIFFQSGDMVVALWERDSLAEDSCVADSGGWGGISLAHNVGSRAEVDEVIEQARAAGARVAREPAATFWGGYNAVFLDPDGHPWEIAHNPGWPLTADGGVRLS
jgi:catechol 2,3-dioxygenase-like lactoylglutathione lyase family enzyme